MPPLRPVVGVGLALLLTVSVAACGGSSAAQQTPAATVKPSPSTLPRAPGSPSATVTEQAAHRSAIGRRLAAMTLRDRVRQLLVVGFSGTRAPSKVISGLHPGGLIYFSGNLRSRPQIRRLSTEAQRQSRHAGEPLLIMTDQEGGIVTRIPGTSGTPGGADFHGRSRWARRTASTTGRLLHRLRINLDLAPVADVNTVGSAGVIGPRSFSSSPHVASRLVHAQVCGYHAGGVGATAKHFPGHGSTTTDSHLTTATIAESRRTWRHVDRRPFVSAIRSGVDMVLVGHLAFPAADASGRPATLSGPVTRGLLRQRLHYSGVVITDALNMGGITSWGSPGQIAVRAISAGVDLLLMPPQPAQAVRAVIAAVRNGRLSAGRINASVTRVLRLKQRLGLYKAASSLTTC